MQRERITINAGGLRIAGLRLVPEAPSPGPALVFLHEGLGCIGMWREFPQAVCRALGHEGLVFDRLGHGESDPLPAPRDVRYLHEEAHARLPAVLAAQGLERPILIGHSDGGSIALLHAAAFPQGTAALVAIAAHVHVEAAALAGIRKAVERWRAGELRSRLERWHGEKAKALFHAWAGTWLAPEFRTWDIAPDLAGLQCPALILQGAADEYATTGHLEAVQRACGPAAEARLLPGLGHNPHLEAPEQVVEAIRAFLAGRGGEGLSRGAAVQEQ